MMVSPAQNSVRGLVWRGFTQVSHNSVVESIGKSCKTSADCNAAGTQCVQDKCVCLFNYVRDGNICVDPGSLTYIFSK